MPPSNPVVNGIHQALKADVGNRFGLGPLQSKPGATDFAQGTRYFRAGRSQRLKYLIPFNLLGRTENIALELCALQTLVSNHGQQSTPSRIESVPCGLSDDLSILNLQLRLQDIGAVRLLDAHQRVDGLCRLSRQKKQVVRQLQTQLGQPRIVKRDSNIGLNTQSLDRQILLGPHDFLLSNRPIQLQFSAAHDVLVQNDAMLLRQSSAPELLALVTHNRIRRQASLQAVASSRFDSCHGTPNRRTICKGHLFKLGQSNRKFS
jgi:hypothetical protein